MNKSRISFDDIKNTEYKTLEAICDFKSFESYMIYKSNLFPSFYGGNGVEIHNPEGKSLAEWEKIFSKHFDPKVFKHITFSFERSDVTEYLIEQAKICKYNISIESYMAIDKANHSISIPDIYEISTIKTEEQWNNFEIFFEEHSKEHETYGSYTGKNALFEKTRETTLALDITWYYISYRGKSEFLSNLGIFEHQGVYRFQNIVTHPLYRRQHLATYLISYVISHVMNNLKGRMLALLADANYHAIDLYKKLGFKEYGQAVCLMKYPKKQL